MKTLICLTLAVSALASPALTFAQTISGQLTRAQVRADIVRVEQAGYRPPSFFGYSLYALLILVPIFVLVTFLFFLPR